MRSHPTGYAPRPSRRATLVGMRRTWDWVRAEAADIEWSLAVLPTIVLLAAALYGVPPA